MAEFVIGVGQQASIRHAILKVEEHLLAIEGEPRQILVHNDVMEVDAERSDYEGKFERYTMQFPATIADTAVLSQAVAQHADCCTLEKQEEGVLRVNCQRAEGTSLEALEEATDAVCEALTLPEVWRCQGAKYRLDPISSELLFQAMIQYTASDVHLSPGIPPVFRIDNKTHHSELTGPLSAMQVRAFIKEIAEPQFWDEFLEHKQTSFNFHQAGLGYSRVSAFHKSGAPHCTLRYLPEVIPSFEDLHVPEDTMVKLAQLHRGLLLVTGMTGSGKTTTVAALIDWINSHKPLHILTIENPIEYVHRNKKSIISQRSLGADVESFGDAVTGALRHDPDVILIGEMRDSDTIRSAINAAATGHLVVSTLHANTASEVVNRIVSFFDPVERDLVRLQLRDCVQCIICQRLVPKKGGGRVPALEILLNDIKAISDGIVEGDTDSIRIGMQQTVSHSILFEQYLYRLYQEEQITIEQGREYSTDESIFDQMTMGTYTVPRLDAIKGKDHQV